MGNKKNILITGSHRSGTTWIGRTISQHSRVRYIHEPFNFSIERPNHNMNIGLNTWFTDFQSSGQKKEIRASFNNLLQSSLLQYAFQACKIKGWDIKTPLRFSKHILIQSLIQPRILIKDPIALLSAGWLYETYDLAVVCMIRNPFAFVGSLKKAYWDFDFDNFRRQKTLMQGRLRPYIDRVDRLCDNSSGFIDRACLLWNIFHFIILEYQKKYRSWLFVKHEDIAMRPVLEFQKIFDYLELNMNSTIRKYIEKYTSQQNAKEAKSTSYQPRNSTMSLDTWKERLSGDEIDRVRISTKNIATQIYENIL